MTKIPLDSKSKRPAFFDDPATDQLMTMMLEMMAELWVVKERVHTLEKVLSTQSLNVAEKMETCDLDADEKTRLGEVRQQFVSNIMRSLEADFDSRASIYSQIDELTDKMKSEAEK